MERFAAGVFAASLVLFWIVAVAPVPVSTAIIAGLAGAWCWALERPA
jgi:hypothetical protein